MPAATPGSPETALLLFCRAPEPGRAKTRLAPLLGAEGAAALQDRMLRRALRTARRSGIGPLTLVCSPDARVPYFGRLAARHRRMSQAEGDIGSRMHAAFCRALRRHRQAILIGADCPALRPADLRRAALLLAQGADIVLAPAEDGGYPLIGLRRPSARLFRGVSWGSARVMAQSRRRIAQLGWRCALLRRLWDVDRPADAERLLRGGWLER